jgi:hypothetical protein
MSMTPDELQALLEQGGLKVKRERDDIVFGFQTQKYRGFEGDQSLMLVASLIEDGEYFRLFAPHAFKVSGPHTDVALRACMMFQWRTKMVQFEYDERDGEVRPIIEFPLEDNKLTDRQVRRCVSALVRLLEEFHGPFRMAIEQGVIDFGDGPVDEVRGQVQALRRIIRTMESTGAPAEQVEQLKRTLAQLETPPTTI